MMLRSSLTNSASILVPQASDHPLGAPAEALGDLDDDRLWRQSRPFDGRGEPCLRLGVQVEGER
jgi:hypothetical protein